MTKSPLVTAREGVTAEAALGLLRRHKIEKLPIVDGQGKLTGLITVKDFVKTEQHPNATKDRDGRLLVGAAVGVGDDAWTRAMTLADAGVDVFVVDSAHGHSSNVLSMIAKLKAEVGERVQIIGGNVATRQGTAALVEAGVDAVKVGVGPGSICTTRVVAGVGAPQITAILEASTVAQAHGVPVIADGGTAVLRRRREGPRGRRVHRDARFASRRHDRVARRADPGRRQAVQELPRHGFARRDAEPGRGQVVLEGPLLPGRRAVRGQAGAGGHRGTCSVPRTAAQVTHQLIGGLRAAMGYTGSSTIEELQNAQFVQITAAGLKESHPHDITMTVEAPNYAAR